MNSDGKPTQKREMKRLATGHVFTRTLKGDLPLAVRTEGLYIHDEKGNRYIDGCSGALISSIGHSVPEVVEAISRQLATMAFAHPSRWRNRPSEEAAEEIAELTPGDLDWVWFVSGGSEAIESAVKLARQYFVERDGSGSQKHLILSRYNSYHGSTIGTMAVGGNMPRRRMYTPMFKDHPKVDTHYCYRCPWGREYPSCGLMCANQVELAIKRTGQQYIATFLAEPVVGSTVGALNPPPEYWPMVREICDRYDILLIADEVMTGFGRTGKAFAVQHWDVVPDIIAAAKSMAAGYIPTGGIFVKNDIVETIKKGSGAFVHGHTYNGNPVSAAATAATVRYMKRNKLFENAAKQGERLGEGLKKLEEIPIVGETRGLGLMRGVEIVADKKTKQPFPKTAGAAGVVSEECTKRGLIIYPAGGMADGVNGDNFMVAPPLVVREDQIGEILSILEESLEAAAARLLDRPR
jgi:adenosylmethionine-8-amino-7-oxononanoate aminotransferase